MTTTTTTTTTVFFKKKNLLQLFASKKCTLGGPYGPAYATLRCGVSQRTRTTVR